MSKQLLTAKEVSEITGLSTARIYELSRRKLIPVITAGDRQYLYPARRIENWCLYGNDQETHACEVQNDQA